MRYLIPHLIYHEYEAGHTKGSFEAASLFMDISGFTQLTETLMQHGKDGADALTKALNELLEAVVHTIYHNQGFIAHFAGDGFVALFTGADRAVYAAQAAHFIQRFFASRGQTTTPYGTFQLEARLGLGTGAVNWYIAGADRQRVFYFQGEALKSCIDAQADGTVGEAVATPEFAKQASGRVLFGGDASRPIISDIPAVLPQTMPTLPDLPDDFLQLFGLRAVLNLNLQGEFRDVASIFIALGEPDAETLDTITRHVADAAGIYGGYLNKVEYADKGAVLLVIFGAPVTYENNLERAAHFLLALRQQALPAAWTAGLTFGTVYAGFLGGVERSEYTVIGDAVNLASRLAHGMGTGSVWTHGRAADRLNRQGYQFEAAGEQRFKGRSGVQVYRLTGTQSVREASPEYPVALVGRAAEIDRLEKAVTPILNNTFGGLVQVNGEVGMGKTRLIHELRQRLPETVSWLSCQADEILRESLNPLRALLMRYFEQESEGGDKQARFDARLDSLLQKLEAGGYSGLKAELERRRDYLAGLIYLKMPDDHLDPALRFENTLAAIKAFILAEAELKPLVLHIDKAHALDNDSQTFLKTLLHNVRDYAFVVLLTSRYDDLGRPYTLPLDDDVPLTAVDLRPLAEESINELVTTMLDGNVNQDTTAYFNQRASGNPRYVEELMTLLKEKDALHHSPWRIKTDEMGFVPGALNEILIARLDRLPPEVKQVVQHAAVLQYEFDVDIMAAMVGGDVKAALQQAVERNLLKAETTKRYRFSNPIMRDVAYEMQPRAERMRWHRRAGEAFERLYADNPTPVYGTLIHHFRHAEDAPRERLYAGQAAAYKADNFANQDALDYLARALELAGDNDAAERYGLLLIREQIYNRLAERAAQQDDLEQLSTLAQSLNDFAKQTEAILRQAHFAEVISEFKQAEVLAGEAAERARTNQQAEQEVDARLLMGTSLLQQGAYEAAAQHFQQALELAEAAHLVALKPNCLSGLGNVYLHRGTDYAGAADYFEQALAIYRQLGDRIGEARTCNNLGTVAFRRSFMPSALEWFEQSRNIFRDIGDRRAEKNVTVNLGIIISMMGDYEKARQLFKDAIVVCREINERRGLAQAHQNLGNVEQYQGNYAEAQRQYEAALTLYHAIGDKHSQAMITNNLGLICRQQGIYDQAEAYYLEAQRGFREVEAEQGLADVPFGLAMIAADVGDYAAAQGYYEQALGSYAKIEDRQAESDVHACLALLKHQTGDDAAALHEGETALNISREIGDTSIQAYALTSLGHAYAVLNQPERARASYDEALQLRLELEELYLAAETRAGLARLALAGGDLAAARAEVNHILEFLAERSLDGTTEPARIYLTCYQVLKAGGDRQADRILAAACAMFTKRAATIPDATRQAFYRETAVHRELLALCGA